MATQEFWSTEIPQGLSIIDWRDPLSEGPCDSVAIVLRHGDATITFPLDSPKAVNEVVAMLQYHRDCVWPPVKLAAN